MRAEAVRVTAAELALRPLAERERVLARCSDGQLEALRSLWSFWAQTGQSPPEGDWRVWLIMAGRGFGKTRAGAEWVRGIAERDRAARIALVGATLPEAVRANMPIGWASPAFDRLQLEDYDWVQAGDTGASARGAAFATARLGYPPDRQDYFSGFVLQASDAATFWPRIEAAARAGQARGAARTFIWALPQVARDGFTVFDLGEGDVQDFDDVDFPLALGAQASVTPAFSTAIVTTAAGVERRNADWSDARLRFDAGPGVRSEDDIATLIAFFRARRGAARGFRFRDPFDFGAAGESLDIGDGTTTSFQLVKRCGDGDEAQVRRITRPVAGSVRVSVGGVEATAGWSLLDGGIVSFVVAPAMGAEVTADYLFDVPVRFEQDSLEVSRTTFLAGEAPSVPLVEVREA